MRAKRVDANHAAVRDGLRAIGASVLDTSGCGDGFPDLVVGFEARTVMVEVKLPTGPRGGTNGSELTPKQRRLHESWRGGPLVVVRSVEEAIEAVCKKP